MKKMMAAFVVMSILAVTAVSADCEKGAERAILAAPCPGKIDVWCVAIEHTDGAPFTGFTKNANGEFAHSKKGPVRVETISVSSNIDFKEWRISPAEAILSIYNGQPLPKYEDSKIRWFTRRGVVKELSSVQSEGALSFFEKKSPIEHVDKEYLVMLLIALFLALSLGDILIYRRSEDKSGMIIFQSFAGLFFLCLIFAIIPVVTDVTVNDFAQAFSIPAMVILPGVLLGAFHRNFVAG